ncbi:uncharacterized protein LOC132748039 [Ruditapes philippinarum]|uniref:uncharacterized protein LOC132748039 n=1 Tax=Ruditapes philippinarum TaxID=129788 RepID=UPI00295B328F|nr:uncharacterized protein LOC132748039 [Ruditapes philippinarum]
MDKIDELVERRRAVLIQRTLAAIQFSTGFLLVFFAAYTAAILHGKHSGAPYYAGAFMTGFAALILSFCGGAVYYTGKNTRLEVLIPTLVKPWVVAHVIISPCATVISIIGIIITGIYGTCQSGSCSYSTNTKFNLGMAIFLLVLEILCLISMIISILISVYYASSFGLHLIFHNKPIPGAVQVRPVNDEVQVSQDMYVQQLWRHKMQNDIDFRKIAEYLEMSRKKKTEETI